MDRENNGHTMVNVTVNVDKDVAVSVITSILKDEKAMEAVSKMGLDKAVETFVELSKK